MDGITEGTARQCGFILPRTGDRQSAPSSPGGLRSITAPTSVGARAGTRHAQAPA
jgi:hypothetical protein